MKRGLVTFAAVCATVAPVHAAADLPKLPPLADGAPFTFAVIGDYRGDSDGHPPAVLLDILDSINRDRANFVLSSGDIINGYPEEDEAHTRKLWKGYFEALRRLKAPVFHIPGNHDIFNEVSTRLWTELLGPTYYAFDFGGVRFIGLDTETLPSRIDPAQFSWLREQLETAGARRVFLFIHQPLFPVDGHIGTSLDAFPAERDRLHELFVAHRSAIQAVFMGHEHLFDFEEREGVRYYISAGSGAPLYVPRELGGIYHYLLVRVTANGCEVELKKLWTTPRGGEPPRVIAPGELLETWEHTVFWDIWDQTVVQRQVDHPTTEGKKALELVFNLAHYEWPSMATTFTPRRDLTRVQRVRADIFVPGNEADGLTVRGVFEGSDQINKGPEVPLQAGWNTLAVNLNERWLAPIVRKSARRFELSFTGPKHDVVRSIVIDNIRAESVRDEKGAGSVELIEAFESPLLWGSWDEHTAPSPDAEHARSGEHGLRLHFDLRKYKRPCLYTELHPAWDFSRIEQLVLEVFVPESTPTVTLHLALTGSLQTCQLPGAALKSGMNHVTIDLASTTPEVRAQVHRVVFWISAAGGEGTGWITLGSLEAGKEAHHEP